MKLFSSYFLLCLAIFPLVITIVDQGRVFARAEDQTDDDINVEEDETMADATVEGDEDAAKDDAAKTQGSPDIDLTVLFTKPEGNGMEIPAGKPVEFLIGVSNTGEKEYVIDSADVSFKYPVDFSFTIQNFSAVAYNKAVKPQQEATVFYNFFPSDSFAGRPMGLQINLAYHDAEGEDFLETVFNSTINIIEVDEGLDGETFFLYVFLLAFAVLLLLAGHYVLKSIGVGGSKKGAAKPQQQSKKSSVEMGTANKNGVDFDWLPDHVKAEMKRKATEANGTKTKGVAAVKSQGTRSSPRLRKT